MIVRREAVVSLEGADANNNIFTSESLKRFSVSFKSSHLELVRLRVHVIWQKIIAYFEHCIVQLADQ